MKRVTIQEIAAELGLSRNTVSKALSDNSSVAEETKNVIINKALEMGYPSYKINIPDNMTHIISTEEKKNILILTRRETANFWNRMLVGISDVINEKQDSMQLYIVNKEDEADNYFPPELIDKIDGMIILSVFNQTYIDKLASYNKPMVFFDAPVSSEQFLKYGDVIIPEGFNSTRIIVSTLIKQGLKRISFLGDISYCKSISDRYLGFISAMVEHSLPIDMDMQFTEHMPERYYDYNEVRHAIESCRYNPDAIVCANDDIAVYVYNILKQRNIDIPKEIAVTGFDNIETAEFLSPTLTTSNVHTQTMGRRLTTQLYHRILHPDAPKELIAVCTDVIFRESSKRRKLF